MEECLLNVRPEFFQNLGQCVSAHLPQELRGVVRKLPAVRVVGVRDRHRAAVAQPLRVIELRASPIFLGHEYTRGRVADSMARAASAQLELPWILMQHRRKETLCKHVSHGLIGIVGDEPVAVTLHPLAERRSGVGELAETGEHGAEHYQRIVE